MAKALEQKTEITIRLSHNQLQGPDELLLTKRQINKIQGLGKGVDIKISKTQITKVVRKGGSLFFSLVSLGAKLLPKVMKVATKVAPGVVTGALSSLGEFRMKKILGQGASQTGGFLIPQNKIQKLIDNIHLLTKKQKEDLSIALQSGGELMIKPTQKQRGGFLGTLLAVIGVPLVLKALTGKGTGKGMRNRPRGGYGMQNRPSTGKGTGKGHRTIIHIHKYRISPPEYLMIDLHCRGSPTSPPLGQAYLIIYGVSGYHSDVSPTVYDAPYILGSGSLIMQANLNMNNHAIINSPSIRNVFVIDGFYNRSVDSRQVLFLGGNQVIVPVNCKILKCKIKITETLQSYHAVTLKINDNIVTGGTNQKSQTYIKCRSQIVGR